MRKVPERLLAVILQRIETKLVIAVGRQVSGVSHYDFVVRPEHAARVQLLKPHARYGPEHEEWMRREIRRRTVPINFHLRFRNHLTVVGWHMIYPGEVKEMGGSLADAMADGAVQFALEDWGLKK